jgi:hypothetical protein
MSYQDHLKTCSYCNKGLLKPTIYVKSASSYNKQKKLTELGAIIKGTSYPSMEPMFLTKGASSSEVAAARARKPGPIEREVKLRELGKMIKGL